MEMDDAGCTPREAHHDFVNGNKNVGRQRFGRVSDGTRTRDHLDHNQELYLLSYAHHAGAQSAPDGI
jgi:hypothetical protein